ncbi:MAG: hypothetical protein IIV23_06755, partial [Ruminococcus sp.]|nr:hypothetical protein [Ruminococcus sp.]
MTTENKNIFRRVTDKVYGGLPMGWPVVILYAVGTALLTTAFLLIPIFENTSFYRVGVTLEAWVFFAVIIMANCKKPLESALKTFVFFLISQPLIYLLQVPFSQMGWGLFMYYRYWFMWTLLTFPMAFVGWYIKKRNWLSLLILLPVVGFLPNATKALIGYRKGNGMVSGRGVGSTESLSNMFCALFGNYKYQYDRYNDTYRWVNFAGDV